MSEIKQYKVGSYRMTEHGDMIFYDDHLAAMQQAKIEAVLEFADALWDTGELSGRDGEFVVSFSKEFIEQLKEQGNE
jgi:hypothetical protein